MYIGRWAGLSLARYAGALGALVAGGRPPDKAAAIASAVGAAFNPNPYPNPNSNPNANPNPNQVGAAFCRAEGWPRAAEAAWVAARAAEAVPKKSAAS